MLNLTSSAIEENLLLFGSKFLQQKDYWINKLSFDIEETFTGFETDIDMEGDFKPGSVELEIPSALSEKLLNFSNRTDVAIYIVLLAVLKILIYRYTGNKDITVISPIFRDNETDETINDYLYIRDVIAGDITGKSLLSAVSHSVLEAYENQDYPVDKLKGYIFDEPGQPAARSISRIVCSLLNIHDEAVASKIKGAIHFRFNRVNDTIDGRIFYDGGIYDERNVLAVPGHFIRVLENVTSSAGIRLCEIPVISPQEKEELLNRFNDNASEFPKELSLSELIKIQAEGEPGAVAVVFQDKRVTYGCLDRGVDQLAVVLMGKGVQSDHIVGVMMERSIEMVIGILGILKAGGAYMPIDPEYPQERIDYMLKDSGAKILINEKFFRGCRGAIFQKSPPVNSNLAYVIYTSGTTGRPKGVMIEHRGMVNHLQAKINDLGLTKESVVLQNASHTFDISVWQFFAALVVGGRVVIYPPGVIMDPRRFLAGLVSGQISIMEVVPSYLLLLLETLTGYSLLLSHLKYILVTGETVSPDLVRQWFRSYPGIKMVNAYGPTEASDDITHHKLADVPQMPRVPIGRPVQNLDIVIADENMNLCPVGIKGEIYVAGVGVGRGYLNNPELSAERFLRNYRSYKSNRTYNFYRTGDVGRWLPGGVIDFFGRKDRQVKVRGFRIELGEIENELTNHGSVREAVVMLREDAQKTKYLCGYLTAKAGEKLDIPDLKEYLGGRLPQYMIPAYLVQLQDIPKTPNGKVDIRALPVFSPGIEAEFAAPRDVVEVQLAEVWSEVLDIDKKVIGREANFFELGGHSLKATILISKIHKKLNVKVPLTGFFKAPQLGRLADLVRELAEDRFASINPVEKREYYPVSSAQKRMFVLAQMKDGGTSDNTPNVLWIEGKIDRQKVEDVFKMIVKRHETLRTSFELINDVPVQRVHESVVFELAGGEVSLVWEDGQIEKMIDAFIRPFDLNKAPLFRAQLVRNDSERHLLMFDMHHIIEDAVSADIFVNDFVCLYNNGELPELRLQYRDFTQWQNRLLQSEAIKTQEKYWLDIFSVRAPHLNFPTDYSRPQSHVYEGDFIEFQLEKSLTGKIQKIIMEKGVTLYMVLLSIYYILLHKYTGQNDIVIGTPISGRLHADLDNIIGFFVNTLAMRNYPNGEKTFAEFLDEVKTNSLNAFENQDYQFEELVNKLRIERTPDRHVLFDTMFVIQNTEIGAAVRELKGLSIKPYNYNDRITQFDIITHAWENDEIIAFRMRYCTRLFERRTMERFVEHFRDITRQISENLDIKISRIEVLSEREKEELLFQPDNEILAQGDEATGEKNIWQLFEEQAEKTPDAIAIVGPSEMAGRFQYLTYRELNRKANQLMGMLRKKKMGPDMIAAIILDNSPEMVIAILGIWKAGGAYLPIAPDNPQKRITAILEDSRASLLLTKEKFIEKIPYISLLGFEYNNIEPFVTLPRAQAQDLDRLQIPDRSTIDYEKYSPYIGQAMVKNSITIQMSRGCAFNCAYCFKIWSKKYVIRSAENIFNEMKLYYEMGVRRFAFVDDLPNIDIQTSSKLFRMIIEQGLKVHLHFPNGIRGDILTPAYIDLMVEAGTVTMDLALETTSPRLQKLIRKNLNLEKLYENIDYITKHHFQVILELQIIHGIPTETEAEARASLDFIKSIQWIHFPYIHILNIYPGSEMAKIAVRHGISPKAIEQSANLAYHELPDTLPFEKSFTRKYQAEFLNEYFLSKERLLSVLPHQMNVLTEDELVQKYRSYLPIRVNNIQDILHHAGITEDELKVECLPSGCMNVAHFNQKLQWHFPAKKSGENALRVLLLDLSQFFTSNTPIMYDVVEPPLGLMYLSTYLDKTFCNKVKTKIAKSRLDFDSEEELKNLISEFNPQIIGIRTLNFYKDFFHKIVVRLRQWGIEVPIIAGGPYATSSYQTMLKDVNIDLAVLGEGEITFAEVIGKILDNNGKLPAEDLLKQIPGIAFIENSRKNRESYYSRHILLMDTAMEITSNEFFDNPENRAESRDLSYIIYTSGSTGNPKGVLVEHGNLVNQIRGLEKKFDFTIHDNYILLAPFTFDVSIMHICLPLVTGGKLFLVPEDTRKDPMRLWPFIYENSINIINLVPAFLGASLQDMGPEKDKLNFKYLFIGGDAFNIELYNRLEKELDAEKIINIYGPTETTINATIYRSRNKRIGEWETIPIGKPLPNYSIYILDNDYNLTPPGVPGEIFISGKGVARGYLNHPELTAERFLKKHRPYAAYKTDILYKTGDLARWLPCGNLEFLGRSDSQVKIRGYRIELGEIERLLLKAGGVKQAAVSVFEKAKGDRYICAYIAADKAYKISELRDYLVGELPEYMMPSYFLQVEKIPLTSTGKLDREALPKPGLTVGEVYTAPRNETEKKLVKMWNSVLNRTSDTGASVGIDDNFFQLGGHSLNAVVLISLIHKEFDVKIPITTFFKKPNIRNLSENIAQLAKDSYTAIEPIEKKEYYPTSAAQKRLYFINRMFPEDINYNIYSFFIIEGKPGKEKIAKTFQRLIERHEAFRTAIKLVDNQVVQFIYPRVNFSVPYSRADEDQINTIMGRFIRPFDLSRAPFLRAELVDIGENKDLFMIDMHHVISDFVSSNILVTEFLDLYWGKELLPLRLQYKDYAAWEIRFFQSGGYMKQKQYWLDRLSGLLPALDLPTDYPRPIKTDFKGKAITLQLPDELGAGIKDLISRYEITPYMTFLAFFIILLAKYSGQNDIIVGSPSAGRPHADLDHIIGFFVNILPMRFIIDPSSSFREFLESVKHHTIRAFENRMFQLDELIRALDLKREEGRNPLYDVVFAVITGETEKAIDNGGIRFQNLGYEDETIQSDLRLGIEVSGQFFSLEFNYAVQLFKPETARQMKNSFLEIIKQILTDDRVKIADIRIANATAAAKSKEREKNTEFNF